MSSTQDTQYDVVSSKVAEFNGQRVRLTYRHNDALRQTGVVRTKDFGHCIDVMIDSHGGQQYGEVTQIEVMGDNGRYCAVWAS